ncbi:hypothetical protein, partial [Oceanispirochaeta sp. M1]|uniref:hypothetical protein n=1 Tax=Oceanispirochaeta sp. M1 TaxID=2283433 RepID=UPI001C132844
QAEKPTKSRRWYSFFSVGKLLGGVWLVRNKKGCYNFTFATAPFRDHASADRRDRSDKSF